MYINNLLQVKKIGLHLDDEYLYTDFILTEKFIEENSEDIDWYYLCRYQSLSEDFMEKHLDKIIWCQISYFQDISENFINKYEDYVEWAEIVDRDDKWSEEFLQRHHKIFEWYGRI